MGCHGAMIGGSQNCVQGEFGVIGGGCCNRAGYLAFVGGGCCNWAYQSKSFIGGGECNCAFGIHSYIVGGTNSKAIHNCSAVFADGDSRTKTSCGPNTLLIDFFAGTFIKNNFYLQPSTSPASISSFGISGQITFDNNYFYRHNGTNWTRTAMSTW